MGGYSILSILPFITDKPTHDGLRYAADSLNTLERRLHRVETTPAPIDYKKISQALQATGSAPLTLTGLPGLATSANSGTSAQRPLPSVNGTFFYETDRDALYIVVGGVWTYVAGVMSGTISPDQKPALGVGDAGFLFYSTDFDRVYRWTGAAWTDAPGQPTRLSVGMFLSAPGTGWQVCDGSTVAASTSTGGTSNVTVPDYTTASYVKLKKAANTVGPTAASGTTANESAHTHAVDPPQTASGNNSAATTVEGNAVITPVSVAADPHTHSTDIASFSSGAGSAHSHGPGTLELQRTELLAYVRL